MLWLSVHGINLPHFFAFLWPGHLKTLWWNRTVVYLSLCNFFFKVVQWYQLLCERQQRCSMQDNYGICETMCFARAQVDYSNWSFGQCLIQCHCHNFSINREKKHLSKLMSRLQCCDFLYMELIYLIFLPFCDQDILKRYGEIGQLYIYRYAIFFSKLSSGISCFAKDSNVVQCKIITESVKLCVLQGRKLTIVTDHLDNAWFSAIATTSLSIEKKNTSPNWCHGCNVVTFCTWN